jgi:hypothetical protein
VVLDVVGAVPASELWSAASADDTDDEDDPVPGRPAVEVAAGVLESSP